MRTSAWRVGAVIGLGMWAGLGGAGAAAAQGVALEPLAAGLASPTAIAHAGDRRLFVALQDGEIVIFDRGAILAEPFLDISARVGSGGERGLLGLAFHPRYRENGYFFVNYTDVAGDTVIARFRASAAANRADAASEAVLLEVPQDFSNHNGGQIAFGPDGYLYVALGDGGSGNDPFCRAQEGSTLLGKILRLDVDTNVATAPFHAVPPDNPFAGPDGVRDEIWALGLRNPWRFSFDRVSGDLYIGDVGQSSREEIDRQPASSAGGENYGWKVMEGNFCLGSTAGCDGPVPGCNAPEYSRPIIDYDHSSGRCAVIGGFVYRGVAVPQLAGDYLYGDLCSGDLWAARPVAGGWQSRDLDPTLPGLATFGEDVAGEIYLAGAGGLFRLVSNVVPPPPCTPDATTLCLSGGRFQVRLGWRVGGGPQAAGKAFALSGDSGYFTFNNPDNAEVFVKVIDACATASNRFWVFLAGLTNVEVTVTVLDTLTGEVAGYHNPAGMPFAPVQDTGAFASCF